MQHATERVERPGESQEALDGKKIIDAKMAVCLLSGRKSKLVVDRYIVQNAVPIPSHNKNRKTKPNQRKNTQAKQAKTHSTKQTEKRKSRLQTSYATSVMSKRDILVSSLVLVWQVKQRQNRKHITDIAIFRCE